MCLTDAGYTHVVHVSDGHVFQDLLWGEEAQRSFLVVGPRHLIPGKGRGGKDVVKREVDR